MLGPLHCDTEGTRPAVYECPVKSFCTKKKSSLMLLNGSEMPYCHAKCDGYRPINLPDVVFSERPKANFCYFTGSNRPGERPMIEGMIRSARRCGVKEDFHAFTPMPIDGAIWHQITPDHPWKAYMAKIDFTLEMATVDAEKVVWLDTDHWFARDPGDLSHLIRDEPVWASMESDMLSPDAKFGNWWGLPLKTKPGVKELWLGFGAKVVSNTNAGMFIVRRDAIPEFHRKCWFIFNNLQGMGFHSITEEPSLAIVAATLVKDTEKNRFEHHSDTWACDYFGAWSKELPNGEPWEMWDWLTQKSVGKINPAIVHMMRGKHLLAGADFQHESRRLPEDLEYLVCRHRKEPTGDVLNCDCHVDRTIYKCDVKGKCLKRFPTAFRREQYPILDKVTVCKGCDSAEE